MTIRHIAAITLAVLPLFPLPATADRTSDAARVEALGTAEIQFDLTGRAEHRMETQVDECTLTISHYKIAADGSKQLEWRDTIPMAGLVFPDALPDGTVAQRILMPIDDTTTSAIHNLRYRTEAPLAISRLVPADKDPLPPFAPGPIIDGTAYVIATRHRGGVTYMDLNPDNTAPDDFANAVIQYRAQHCTLIG
ncbi:hypothetical protein [Pseudooceanicola sp. MF1-13]|uniref:hypothetical protein n=1 Tax=Pseudooceanicola sp. MF1-13 TaxID=3379095 RepID=UPI00389279D9